MIENNLFLIIGISVGIFLVSAPLIREISESIIKRKHAKQKSETDTILRRNHPSAKDLPEFSFWKSHIEPKYRDSDQYPPDWVMRRKYIAEIYNYKCAICQVEARLGHTHHIQLLTEGGTNDLNNLAYVCRNCHENQHWHMTKQQERRNEEIERRGISEADYFEEKKRDYRAESEIDALFGHPDRKLRVYRAKIIRAKKQGSEKSTLDILSE